METPASEKAAGRLRRGLLIAGITRLPLVRGRRGKVGREDLSPDPSDPLFFETETTLPVDFHSFRRGFATALAGLELTPTARVDDPRSLLPR